MTNIEDDINEVDEKQKEFLSALLDWRPDFRKFCKTERSNNGVCNLRVEIPSPVGDSERNIFIWVDDGDISIEFGLWHTHGSACIATDEKGRYEEYSIIELIQMIIANRVVYFIELGGAKPYSGILNLDYKNSIIDLITEPGATGQMDIRSWDGSADRRVTLKDAVL